MTFQRTYQVFTYLTALWAFLVMAFFIVLHPVGIALFLFGLLLCAMKTQRGWKVSNTIWVVLSIAALVIALFGWFALGEHLYSVVYLFLFLEINKLWSGERTRDVLQVYGLTFFQMLAASVSTASLLFAPALFVYMFLVLGGLITLTMRRDAELALSGSSLKKKSRTQGKTAQASLRINKDEQRRLAGIMHRPLMTRWFAMRLVTILLLVAIGGMGFFFIIPRLQAQNFLSGIGSPRQAQAISGFSDTVEFSSIDEIQTNPAIIMRAVPVSGYEFSNGFPDRALLRLRGVALSHYDGRRWRKDPDTEERNQFVVRRSAVFFPHLDEEGKEEFYQTEITLEPNRKGYLFGPDRPVRYDIETPIRMLIDTESRSIQALIRNWAVPLSYRVRSQVVPEGIWQLKDDTAATDGEVSFEKEGGKFLNNLIGLVLPPKKDPIKQAYLQMPEHPDMTAVRGLAEEWASGLEQVPAIAKKIEMELKRGYDYSLQIDFSSEPDHLTRFLTGERRGHCEYFATAMALMLRSQGVPARLVNGYASDEWVANGDRGYYLIRQEHAHSWVEVYDERAGWLVYDPTPDSGIGGNRIPNSLYRQWSRWLDTMKLKWYENIIDYDARDQGLFYMNLFRSLDLIPGRGNSIGDLFDGTSSNQRKGLIVIVLAVAAGLGFFLIREIRRFIRSRERTLEEEVSWRSSREPIREYVNLLSEVEKQVKRPDSQTPLEYARRVVRRSDEFQDFLPLTENYYGARFNGSTWSESDTNRARALLRRLRESPQNLRPVQSGDYRPLRKQEEYGERRNSPSGHDHSNEEMPQDFGGGDSHRR